MQYVLIRIDAQDAAGDPLVVRLASHDDPRLGHLDNVAWTPAIERLPNFALDFFGGAFSGEVTSPRTSFAVATSGVPAFAADPAERARFADAQVRIWVGDNLSGATADLGPLTLRFDGRVTAEPEVDEQARVARFDAAVQDAWADEPLLDVFDGSGAEEGPADLEGTPKPLVLGNVRFARGVLIDNVDNVYAVSGRAVQAVNAVYDRLASLGASSGNYADFAALVAAEVPAGSWATCHALGLVRLGAPPDGRVSFDVSGDNTGSGGYVRRPGAIIGRIAAIAGGTASASTLAALDVARPYDLQIQLSDQITAREIIARTADSVGAVAGVSLLGKLFAHALQIGAAPLGTGEVTVLGVEELAKGPPAWKLATEAELTFEVHSADEAAFQYNLRGLYSATRVHRLDDVVTSDDGSAWLYINAVPSAGNAPPVWPVTSNDHWQNLEPPAQVVTSGLLSERPVSGDFVGQVFNATDTDEVFLWNGTQWALMSDVTLSAVREIIPEFPIVQIREFELGNEGTRTVSHFTRRGGVAIGGGTWSLPQVLLGAGTATINATTGLLSLSGIVQSGSYTVRYTHTDTVKIDLQVNVNFVSVPQIVTPAAPLPASIIDATTDLTDSSTDPDYAEILDADSLRLARDSVDAGRVDFELDPGSYRLVGTASAYDGAISGISSTELLLLDASTTIANVLEGPFEVTVQFATQLRLLPKVNSGVRIDGLNVQLASTPAPAPSAPIVPKSINAQPATPAWFEGVDTSRTVTHVAVQGATTLSGGAWSLPTALNMSASINSSNGTVTITSVSAGQPRYLVRYTHSDSSVVELWVNVIFYPSSDEGRPTLPGYNEP